MKLLLDQGLPRSCAQVLKDRGVDAVHVAEIGLATAADRVILDKAAKENRIVVTFDADFHALLALSQSSIPSVIRIRQEGLKADEAAALIQETTERCEAELKEGALVTMVPPHIRVRLLPLTSKT